MSYTQRQLQLKQRFLQGRGLWTEEWQALLELNPDYFEGYLKIRDVSERNKCLSHKVQEFIYIAVAASCTHMYLPGVRAHTQAALAVGATIEEITEVVGLTYLLGIHSVSNGSQILLELMEELGIEAKVNASFAENRKRVEKDFIKYRGFFPETFRSILQLDPLYLEAYTEFSSLPTKTQVLEPKVREIIVCAFDAATTHLYHRGTRIHMRNALKLGATPDEIMEMLEITSLIGIHGVVATAPLLAGYRQNSTTGNICWQTNGVEIKCGTSSNGVDTDSSEQSPNTDTFTNPVNGECAGLTSLTADKCGNAVVNGVKDYPAGEWHPW